MKSLEGFINAFYKDIHPCAESLVRSLVERFSKDNNSDILTMIRMIFFGAKNDKKLIEKLRILVYPLLEHILIEK